MNKRSITTLMILTLMVLALMACENVSSPGSGSSFAYPTFTPSPLSGYNQDASYAAAQATLASGQNNLMELSRQATVVSLSMNQAANAAEQATLDYNQRQLMELSIRGTEISQILAQAAATEQFITEHTQMAQNATATSQSQEATATYSTYILNVTQTAQAYAILSIQATETAQAYAAFTSYSLTATPLAAIQASNAQTQQRADQRAFWEDVVVKPTNLFLTILVILLLILGGVLAYQRLMPVLELYLRTFAHDNNSASLLVDGVILNPDTRHEQLTPQGLRRLIRPRVPKIKTVQVEIIGPSEPSVINWITEAEMKLHSKLHSDGRRQL